MANRVITQEKTKKGGLPILPFYIDWYREYRNGTGDSTWARLQENFRTLEKSCIDPNFGYKYSEFLEDKKRYEDLNLSRRIALDKIKNEELEKFDKKTSKFRCKTLGLTKQLEDAKRKFSNATLFDSALDENVDEFLAHYNESTYDYPLTPRPDPIPEADKSKSISEMTTEELRRLMSRLRDEREAEDIIRSLRRSAGLKDSYENPAKIDTKTPVDQLYHWGILGQKWGVRRFQNADGSRTAAGKRREAQMNPERVKRSEDYIKSRSDKKKAPAGLSNEELKKLNERLQLEETFKKLSAEKVQASESFVKRALKKAGEDALADFSKNVMLGGAKLLLKNLAPTLAAASYSGLVAKVADSASTGQGEKRRRNNTN